MRIGIFGGSFDPVHCGHLLLAEYCREERSLDEVWFVPAFVAPHKSGHLATDGAHRFAMLELAVRDNPAFRVSRVELDRGGVSYTADTLVQFRTKHGKAELFLMLGADSLADLPTWRAPETICELATLLVVGRPGAPEPDFSILAGIASSDQIERFHAAQVEMPLVDLSSSEIRRRIAGGYSVKYQTPDAVITYIAEHVLYAIKPESTR